MPCTVVFDVQPQDHAERDARSGYITAGIKASEQVSSQRQTRCRRSRRWIYQIWQAQLECSPTRRMLAIALLYVQARLSGQRYLSATLGPHTAGPFSGQDIEIVLAHQEAVTSNVSSAARCLQSLQGLLSCQRCICNMQVSRPERASWQACW